MALLAPHMTYERRLVRLRRSAVLSCSDSKCCSRTTQTYINSFSYFRRLDTPSSRRPGGLPPWPWVLAEVTDLPAKADLAGRSLFIIVNNGNEHVETSKLPDAALT